jgi:hypothetical protein
MLYMIKDAIKDKTYSLHLCNQTDQLEWDRNNYIYACNKHQRNYILLWHLKSFPFKFFLFLESSTHIIDTKEIIYSYYIISHSHLSVLFVDAWTQNISPLIDLKDLICFRIV